MMYYGTVCSVHSFSMLSYSMILSDEVLDWIWFRYSRVIGADLSPSMLTEAYEKSVAEGLVRESGSILLFKSIMYVCMDVCSSGCSRADSLRLCKAAAEERLAQCHTCRGCYALLVIQYINRYIHTYIHTPVVLVLQWQ